MQVSLNNRVIFYNGTSLVDVSDNLNDYLNSETISNLTASKYIYIGSELPFNHRFLNVSTVNTNASLTSVHVWGGESWKQAVDILDGTLDSTQTKSFSKPGIISWSVAKEDGWYKKDTDRMTGSGLETLKIYDLYWARISVSAAHSSGAAANYIGWKFSDDSHFGVYYPDLNTNGVKTQFASGKTTWNDQHHEVASIIVRDLTMRQNADIVSPNQIIRWEWLSEASNHRLAELIYNSFGPDGEKQRDAAQKKYKESLMLAVTQFDMNGSTRLEHDEIFGSLDLVRR